MFVNTLLLILSLWGTGWPTTCCCCIGAASRRNYSQKLSEESLDVACRSGLDELDELEGLGLVVVVAVDLA